MKIFILLFMVITCMHEDLSAIAKDTVLSSASDTVLYEPEKLYVHTDKECYFPGDTIWLKGYLTNSSYLSQTPVSNFIYIELCCDTVVSRVKIKKSEKGFAGYLSLDQQITPGSYTLRGYTRNMQNYPVEYMFYKSIEIPGAYLVKPSNHDLDVQFLPESGRYLTGRPTNIAFKAISSDGRSANVNVQLYNMADSLIGHYESKHCGMGLISLLCVDSKGYYALVKDSTGFSKRVILPAPEASGATISVSHIGKVINVSAYVSPDIKGATLVIGNGSETIFSNPVADNIALPEKSLAEGVNFAQIRNSEGEIIAERLFFIKPALRSGVSINQNKQEYGKRDKVELILSLKDGEGRPVPGEFSIAVTDGTLVPLNVYGQNITSYMELSSELKGEVENPGYYLNNNSPESNRYLDLVMMTNGWRFHTSGSAEYKREYSQEISGNVSGLFRDAAVNTTLMVFAPKINLTQAYFLNKKSTFVIEGLDFPDSTKFLLGVAGKNGGQFYTLHISKQNFPPFQSPSVPLFYGNSEVIKTAALANGEKIREKAVMLKAVVVKAPENNIVKPKFNPSPYLETFSKGQIKERQELEDFDQSDLMTYLSVAFPGLKIGYDEESRKLFTTRALSINGLQEPLLYVDGLKWGSTALLDQYGWSVMDVENVAFLRGNEGARYNSLNGVILITSRRTSAATQYSVSTNTAKISPLGYQHFVEYYTPKYNTETARNSQAKDNRSTLYWNPSIHTDNSGTAIVTFFTGDRAPKLNINLQGFTSSGEFIYKLIGN